MSRVLYKYLDIKGGKMMIGMEGALKRPNIQFTNASQLNDPFDCHPNLVDYSDIPESVRHRKWLFITEVIDLSDYAGYDLSKLEF